MKTDEKNIEPQTYSYMTANPLTYVNIKPLKDKLKRNQTLEEKLIWEYLRNKKLGHKFRRQHIIDNYIPDFVCLEKKLIIEIDGEIHLKQVEKDRIRTENLNNLGYIVHRFTNNEVLQNTELVASKIKEILNKL